MYCWGGPLSGTHKKRRQFIPRMEFCGRCGAIMHPKDGTLRCACGNRQPVVKRSHKETHEHEVTQGVVDHTVHPLAAFDHVCSRCGFGKAQLVSKGVFITDEDEAIEYICGRCGNHDPEEGLKIT